MTDAMFKPGYDGERPSPRLTGPERQTLLQRKAAIVRRLHDAMLTMSVMGGTMNLGVGNGAPAYIEEFGDRVSQEVEEAPRARFKPTAAQVSDFNAALGLLEGLRPHFFKVVLFRALDEFARENGEIGDWPWRKVGAFFGLSDKWAEGVYNAAIIQAARRSGLLPIVSQEHAVLVCSVWIDHAWLSQLSTSTDPRHDIANLRVKSPVRLTSSFAIWTAGKPLAKRLMDAVKPEISNDHASWYRANPDVLAELLIRKAQEMGASWHLEDLDAVVRRQAA